MRRWWLIAALAILVGAAATQAQDVQLLGYVRDDLELISQESLPTWSERWTGPVEAATILAWEAENGYARFVRDYNGDGVVDELDTIQLADELGRMLMATETTRGTTDVRLVLGLAQYVAGLYPDEFVLKIYDMGFPGELLASGLGAYSPTMVPGIILEVKPGDPNIAAYELEMDEAEGVIVGLHVREGENNQYLAGRSYLYALTSEGYTPVDFAWSQEDPWQSGAQGQVLQTVARMSDRMYVEYKGQWTEVEFMLALSPLREPPTPNETTLCPPNAIAYDVTESSTPYGRVKIEECVTREMIVGGPVLDTYTYTVTNINYLYGTCGICLFYIPNLAGFSTMNMTGPAFWMQHAGWGAWWWRAPVGSCGIQPGNSSVFSFTVIGPTADTWVTGGVAGCVPSVPTVAAVAPPISAVRTTGPGKPGEPDDGDEPGECPDLVIEIKSASCTYEGREFEVRVTATVTNIGDAPSASTFARLASTSGYDSDLIGALDPGETEDATFILNFTANQLPDCPLEITVEVDPYHTVEECDETNNEDEDSVYCPNCKVI